MLIGLMMMGCSGLTAFDANDGLQATSTSEDVVLREEAVLLDHLPGVEAVEVEGDRIHLTLTSEAPAIPVGAVVVGTRGGGVLGRVEQVIVEGAKTTLVTSPAKLTDVVESGRVDALLQLDPNRSDRRFDFGSEVLLDQLLWSDEAGDYVQVRIETDPDAHAGWTPEIDYDIDVGFTHIDAAFDSTIHFEYEADFVATVSGEIDLDESIHLLTEEFPFTFMMGEVPVWGEARVKLYADLELLAAGEITTTLHTEAHATASASAAFYDAWGPNNRRWETSIGGSLEGDEEGRFLWAETGGSGFATTRVGVRAEITLELYNAAGAVVEIEPSATLETCDNLDSVSLRAGIEGTHRYYFEALGWRMYDSEAMGFSFGPWTMLECEG